MIRFIEDKNEKSRISREILEALTDWFEVEESREQYIRESEDQPFWAAVEDGVFEGFSREYIPVKRKGAYRCGEVFDVAPEGE